MSDSPFSYAFPQRTPIFTTVLVLLCFAVFGWLAYKIYVPKAYPVVKVEGVKSPAERKHALAELRQAEQVATTTYGWADRSAGVVRLPIDRAMSLVVKEVSAGGGNLE